MTWGEIQIISLQKMFAKDTPIQVSDLSTLINDDDCKIYLSSMPAVANEGLQRIKPHIKPMYTWNSTTKVWNKTTIDKIESTTLPSYSLTIPEDACVLLPLYIASQLYKDDDISQATAYRNEFEAGLQDLESNISNTTTIEEVY